MRPRSVQHVTLRRINTIARQLYRVNRYKVGKSMRTGLTIGVGPFGGRGP
jgi:hypothetical protein